jgi:hypothetical protein
MVIETHTTINNFSHGDSPDKYKIGMTIKKQRQIILMK